MHDDIRVVAVDPGNNLGVAVIDFNLKDKVCKVRHAHTFDLKKAVPDEENGDKRAIIVRRLQMAKSFLKKYFETWRPNFGAHETAYVPHGGGGASVYSFASLVENIISIKFAFFESAKDAKVFEVNPTTMKICIVGFKSSDKTLILKALKADPTVDLSEIDVGRLNQHNADAIGIGITCIRENFSLSGDGENTSFNLRRKGNGGKKPSKPKRRRK